MAYQRVRKLTKSDAYEMAQDFGINFKKSPFQLSNDEKYYLIELAKKTGYRKSSSSANSMSRATAFFEYLKK